MLTSLVMKEMQNKVQEDITSHLLEWLLSKRQEITTIDKDVGKKTTLVYCLQPL